MPKKRIKNILYISSTIIIAFPFAINLIINAINTNIVESMGKLLYIEILICAIIFSLAFFSFFILFQYKIKNQKNILSCMYNTQYLCCLIKSYSLNDFFKNSSELITDIELAKYEQQVQTKEIWLLSSDLSVECGNNIFKEVVRARLKEGVKYSFIALDSPIAQERARKIKNQYKSFLVNKNMHFYLIKGSEYALFLSLYALAIYNPDNLDNTQAYVCIGESGGSETSIYAKLNQSHTQNATNITREIINSANEFNV